MAIVKSTFNATAVKTFCKTGVYNRFWTGLGEQETIDLGDYHAYVGLAWFDASAVSAAIANQRVTKVTISARSTGSNDETSDAVPVRVYRTNISIDASKTGGTSADSLRPAQGMTYSAPYNDHFIQYAETSPMIRGGTLTDAIVFESEDAQIFATALSSGYALGSFALPNTKKWQPYNGTYRARYLEDITVNIYHEPEDTKVTAPTSATVLDAYTKKAGTVRIRYSGATQPESGANPITGYNVAQRRSTDGGETWAAWNTATFYEASGKTSGTLDVTVKSTFVVGVLVQYRIATVSAENTSDYLIVNGYTTITANPAAPTVSAEANGRTVTYTAQIDASSYDGNLLLYAKYGDDDEQIVAQTTSDGGSVTFSHVFGSDGTASAVFVVGDEYTGRSSGVTVTTNVARTDVGKNWFSFNGRRSDDLGLIVSEFLTPSSADETVTNTTIVGRSGDVQQRDNERGTHAARDMTFAVYARDGVDLDAVRSWLTGDGVLIMGDHPTHTYDASIQKTIVFKRYTRGAADMVIDVTAHVQPYHGITTDHPMTLSKSGLVVFNDGTVASHPVVTLHGSGDITLTIGGESVTVYDVDTSCTIDTAARAAVDANGSLLETYGTFPQLETGANVVVWSDNASTAEIDRRVRYM